MPIAFERISSFWQRVRGLGAYYPPSGGDVSGREGRHTDQRLKHQWWIGVIMNALYVETYLARACYLAHWPWLRFTNMDAMACFTRGKFKAVLLPLLLGNLMSARICVQ